MQDLTAALLAFSKGHDVTKENLCEFRVSYKVNDDKSVFIDKISIIDLVNKGESK